MLVHQRVLGGILTRVIAQNRFFFWTEQPSLASLAVDARSSFGQLLCKRQLSKRGHDVKATFKAFQFVFAESL